MTAQAKFGLRSRAKESYVGLVLVFPPTSIKSSSGPTTLEYLQSLFERSKVLSQIAGDDETRRAFERIVEVEGTAGKRTLDC